MAGLESSFLHRLVRLERYEHDVAARHHLLGAFVATEAAEPRRLQVVTVVDVHVVVLTSGLVLQVELVEHLEEKADE